MAVSASLTVKPLDVIKHICLGFLPGHINTSLDTLLLQAAEEGFSHRVVIAVAPAAHAPARPIQPVVQRNPPLPGRRNRDDTLGERCRWRHRRRRKSRQHPGREPAASFRSLLYWHPVTPSRRGWRRSGPGHRQMDCHRPRRHDLGPFGERPEQVRHTPAPKAGANSFSSVKIATRSIVGPCLRQNRHRYTRRSQALRASSRSTINAAKPSAISQTSTPIGAVSNSQLPAGV